MDESRAAMKTLTLFSLCVATVLSLAATDLPKGPSPAPLPPARILSLAPSITEILYGLGVLDRVVGRTDFCDYPPQVKSIPSVGGWLNPSIERMIALQPDLAILMKAQDLTLENKLRELKIAFLEVRMETSGDIRSAIRDIGAAVGRRAEAGRLVRDIDAAFANTRKRAARFPRKKVLLVVGRTPGSLQGIFVAGRETFLDEMLAAAGGDNVAHDRVKGYGNLSPEGVIALDPDVILEVQESGSRPSDPARDWAPLKSVAAVRRHAILALRDEVFVRPSQRIIQALKLVYDLLHPGPAIP